MKYSIIVPVYNRPDEVDELLQSLTEQTLKDMEVIIVEDGSSQPCENIVHRYAGKLQLRYYTKENSGPGQTRNFGAEHSQGEYLIFLDSDCVLPPDFLKRRAETEGLRCLGRTRQGSRKLHKCAEGHQLQHDFVPHDWRHSWRKETNGQEVLSALV